MRVDWNDKAVMAKINKEAGKDAEEAASMVARTARHTRLFKDISGDLRKSIRVDSYPDKREKNLVVAGGKGPWGDAWYAPMVHLGHRIGKTGRHASARPFLWRAVDANRAFIKAVFKKR